MQTVSVHLPKFEEVSHDERQRICNILGLTFVKVIYVARESTLTDLPLSNLKPCHTVDVTADGACAYRALALHLTGSQNEHIALRRLIQQHLYDNSSDYELYYQGKLSILVC